MSGARESIVVAAVALLSVGCGPATAFECESDTQCVRSRMAGTCEPVGFCSFPDSECASGRRYAELAGAGVAAQCVAPEDDSQWSDGSAGGDATSDASSMGESTTDVPAVEPDPPAAESSSGAGPVDMDDAADDASATGDGGTGGTGNASGSAEESTTGSGSEGCAMAILDDFEDGVVDPAWNVNLQSGGAIDQDDGELRVTIAAWQGGNSIVSQPVDDSLLGGWAVLRLSTLASPASSAQSGLVVAVGGCDLQLYVHEGGVRALRYSPAEGPEQFVWAPLPAGLPLWLRIRLDDGAHFEISTDAATWTTVASDGVPECGDLDEPAVVGMFAGGTPSSALTRTFDEIAVCVP